MKRDVQINKIIIDLVVALLVFLFVYAAISKLTDFEKFQVQLGKSPIVNPFVHIVAYCVPGLELTISGLLMFKVSRFFALQASFTLMVIFSAYIVVILKFSSYIPCSCGGVLQNMTWTQHLYFNLSFVVLSAIAILRHPYQNNKLIGHKRVSRTPESSSKITLT